MIEHIRPPKRQLIPLTLILGEFGKQKKISTYEVCNRLKSTQYKRAYSNIRSRIRTLIKQKLIEKTDKTIPPRGANYYTLTGLGIEHLLLDKSWLSKSEHEHSTELVRLIKNFGDYIFFETFAYQFFEKNTLQGIKNYYVSREIFEYFENCVKHMRFKPGIDLEAYERGVSPEQMVPLKKYIAKIASEDLEKLIFTLISYSDKQESSSPTMSMPLDRFDEYLYNDLKLLARDKKFLKSAIQARKRLDTSYKKFMEFTK